MRYLKTNIGPIAVLLLMLFMAYRDFKLHRNSDESLFLFYMITAIILFGLLVGIYLKFYFKK